MPKRILIVDDEDDIREVAATSLELVSGWDVQCARSGQEAIDLARVSPPDAILLDVMMPDMDGPTTLEHLRQISALRDVPVVFLTAKVQGLDQQRIASMNPAAVLSKPFDPMTLGSELARALGWSG